MVILMRVDQSTNLELRFDFGKVVQKLSGDSSDQCEDSPAKPCLFYTLAGSISTSLSAKINELLLPYDCGCNIDRGPYQAVPIASFFLISVDNL